MSGLGTSIAFSPLLPWMLLAILGGAGLFALLIGLVLRARGALLRGGAMAILWLILANPSLIIEKREPIRDIAVVVVDESASQALGKRTERTKAALEHVRKSLRRFDDLTLRVVRGGTPTAAGERISDDGTVMFGPLERALSDIPRRRLAGVIMITDGQVHDVPAKGKMIRNIGPLHVLLTGDKDEADRRLVVENAPAFGLIGKRLQMKVRVDDNAAAANTRARVTIKRDGKVWRRLTVPVGRSVRLDFELEHSNTTFFEMEVEKGRRELTLDNNRAVVAINGIRDRLRVLLISGEPHPGERSWRNLLKADPAVDLVHFTILRPPDKRDATPVNELALISFPVRELFQVKLKEFDLIIFDRYRRRGVILSRYLQNIADYVRDGGALLVAVGPSFANRLSLYHTPIGPVLPGRPTGEVIVQGFRAGLSEKGKRHPVTATLRGADAARGAKPWGRWFRQIGVSMKGGDVLMIGAERRPLLVLDRVGKGRVAQILSDQAWLWGRGFEGGGPQAEMLRRVAHWLMKEPELEENTLTGRIRGGRLHVTRRSLTPTKRPVTITGPSGKKQTITLKDVGNGRSTGSAALKEPGLYRITDGKHSTMAAVGSINPRETADVRATDKLLRPVIAENTGSVTWLGDAGNPEIRRIAAGRDVAGRSRLGTSWIGLKRNGEFTVTGIREVPLLVGLLALLIALVPLIWAWRREGR